MLPSIQYISNYTTNWIINANNLKLLPLKLVRTPLNNLLRGF